MGRYPAGSEDYGEGLKVILIVVFRLDPFGWKID